MSSVYYTIYEACRPHLNVKKYKFFIKYSLIGFIGASLDFLVFVILNSYLGIYFLIANTLSILLGITNNFILNTYFNFKKSDQLKKRYLKFLFIGLLGLLLSNLLIYVLVDMKISVFLAKLFTIIFIVFIQYNLNKYITFK